MFDFSSLPVSGGVVVAGLLWAGVAGFVLGPIVADRTIENSGWQHICERNLRSAVLERVPRKNNQPDISCNAVMGLFGRGMENLCAQGGNQLFDLLKMSPAMQLKKQARQREIKRLTRIAAQAPSRCQCAASVVAADRLTWGLYAGSARLIGGSADLRSDLTHALHSSRCARLGEAVQ